ncbi:thioredoxin family protein [Bacteroidota bacterium]
MKKTMLIGLIAMTLSSVTFAEGIKWHTWDEGVKMAKKENKPMMVFVYASWCHVCKKMNDKTFRSGEVVPPANQNFIPVKLDIDAEETYTLNGKSYKGKEILLELAVGQQMGIPTTIFYYPKSDKKFLEVGYKTADEFVPVLKKYAELKP